MCATLELQPSSFSPMEEEFEWKKLISSALKAGDMEALQTLLKGHDVNAPRFGETQNKPLLHSILHDLISGDISDEIDSEKILRVLDECGSDANLLDGEGDTPLSICISGGYDMEHITEQLVNVLGADITKEQSCFDDAVAELGDIHDNSTCELLMRLGLKPEADGRYTRLLFNGGKEKGSAEGYEHMLKQLLDWNLILPDERDAKQNTPLHYVVRVLDCDDDYCSRQFYSNRLEKEDYISDRERLSKTLLETLLDRGATPLAKNANGKTALDVWLKHRKLRTGDTDDVEELLLNRMADARERLYLEMMDLFAQTDMGMRLDAELIEIIKKKACLGETRGKRFSRQQEINAMLAAESIPPDGYYYRDCIEGIVEIDITEFRFRHYIATTCALEYDDIVEKLREDYGRFYSGIHSDAREIMDGRLEQRGVSFK